MNTLIDNFFYLLWKIINPISYFSFIVSNNTKIDRKQAFLGNFTELETLANLIKDELFNSNLFLKKVEEAKKSLDFSGFSFDCYDYLSIETKNKIFNLAYQNHNIISLVSSFLGIKPTLNTISIYANVPRNSDSEVGSKMWHRDGITYLTGDFMFAITEINDNNGPFYWIDPKFFGSSKYFLSKQNTGWENSGRFSDEDLFNSGLDKNLINKFEGLPGNYILLNTGESFHKGGFCKSDIRVLGRFIYSSNGYSKGNLKKFNKDIKINYFFPLTNILYIIHEKFYRNIIKLTKKKIK